MEPKQLLSLLNPSYYIAEVNYFPMVDDLSITVLKELKEFIVPLTEDEFNALERSIVTEGCRDPLIVWRKTPDKLFLVDGHNRLKICQKYNLPYKIRKKEFADLDEIKIWMIGNQLGRRNLNTDQLSYYRGLQYINLRKSKGGYDKVLSKGQNDLLTTEVLAERFKVSESTIKRDAKFALGLEIIGRSNPELKYKILSGGSKVKKSEIRVLADYKHSDKLSFKNESDVYNKAKKIRDEILDEVEKNIDAIQKNKLQRALASIEEKEPVFVDREDRLKRIKGKIISAINRAISDKDVNAVKELKNLIDRFVREL